MENIVITPKGFERASDKLGAQLDNNLDDVVVEEPSSESVPETVIETAPEPAKEPDEEKVPKSRFLTVSQRAIDAEKKLREYEAERSREVVAEPADEDEELKQYFVETFGDTEAAQKLYKNELARLNSITEKAAERAFERFSKMGEEQEEVINQRVASFDNAFEELAIAEGKTDFSDDEQVAILDIVEKYSPKDSKGRLIGEYLLPLDQAYEIYQVQQGQAKEAKRGERNQVASLSGARSEGAPSSGSDADWRPGQGRRWWNKVD